MLRSSFCDYSDAYILAKGTITVAKIQAAANNATIIFKNCAPFITCISRIHNMQVDDAHDVDVVMAVYHV